METADLVIFEDARRRLFGVAYRMLGSAAEADDVVQETWLRWQLTDRSRVREPIAFLTTVATRLSINAATSAQTRRTTYLGPWLPEPVDTTSDPALGAEEAAVLDTAILVLLERLTPQQRAAYILHEAFAYSFREVGVVLEVSEAAARQSAARARARVGRPVRATASAQAHRKLLDAFLRAARAGDLAGLEALLAADVRAVSDGGGLVSAARVPVIGRSRVARFLIGAAARLDATSLVPGEANGAPAARILRGGEVIGNIVLAVDQRRVTDVFVVLNPHKLTRQRHHNASCVTNGSSVRSTDHVYL